MDSLSFSELNDGNRFMKYTRHFLQDVWPQRSYLKEEWLKTVLENPIKKEVQENGKMKFWGYIEELGKHIRVVTLEDGETVHTAFPDRNYKEAEK